jgi:hypothetical protein
MPHGELWLRNQMLTAAWLCFLIWDSLESLTLVFPLSGSLQIGPKGCVIECSLIRKHGFFLCGACRHRYLFFLYL